MEQPPAEDGYPRGRPGLPTGIVIISIVVALVAVSGLIALLYRETRGPGEILREFARHVDEGDCEASYELIHETVQASLQENVWCEDILPDYDQMLDADFEVERAVLEGETAIVEVSGVGEPVWVLRRHGERSWRVIGPRAMARVRLLNR